MIRRRLLVVQLTAAAGGLAALCRRAGAAPQPDVFADAAMPPERRFHEAAEAMRQLARSWGDQPYGAVLVAGTRIAGEGPSRVVRDNDPLAHAERVAIRDAQRRLGRAWLGGAVLYSTSRPCRACEATAAAAGVSRMIHGSELEDAGPPRASTP